MEPDTAVFACFNCNLNLTGYRYILRDEKPFCIKCYESLFANACEDCKTPIGTDSKVHSLHPPSHPPPAHLSISLT